MPNIPTYLPLMVFLVQECPRNRTNWLKASERLNCSIDTPDNTNLYHCVPSQDRSSLLEFCFIHKRIGVQEGHCMALTKSRRLNPINCSDFRNGCPTSFYFSNKVYEYPACLEVDIHQRCFLSQKNCLATLQNTTNNIHSNLTVSTEVPGVRKDGLEIGPFLPIVITACLLFVLGLAALIFYLYRRKALLSEDQSVENERTNPETTSLLFHSHRDTSCNTSLLSDSQTATSLLPDSSQKDTPSDERKGDFSQPGEKKNRTESLESESEKLDSRGATKMINSGVAGKKRKLPRRSTSKGRPQQGAKLRKTDDNSGPYIHSEIIHEMQVGKGIGCIQFTMSNSCGTGFRVGSKYIITAFHVMEDILIPFWKQAHEFLSAKERKEIKWTKDTLPVAGCWNLSKLFSSLDPIKREILLERGKEMITDSCLIEMNFKKITRGTPLKFSNDPVTFACKKNDVVILELAEQEVLPRPLILTDYSIPGINLHVLGHPDKKVLQYDPECRIVDNKAELSEIVEKGISYFTENGFDSQDVKEDYAPCKLSRDHILFHCSKTTAHGASGSPLVVVTDKARVLGMLQTGHPKLYYNYSRIKPLEDHPELLVECGISMKKVKSLLDSHSLFQLSNDLFSQELCSQVAQDVRSLTLN